jgi:hypothetical protein
VGSSPGRVIPKTIQIDICCFSGKHAAIRRKSKDWLVRQQNNVSEWGDMSTSGLLFQWATCWYACFYILVCPFVLFLLAIMLSVLLRYTDSDYPFGIFKLFSHNHAWLGIRIMCPSGATCLPADCCFSELHVVAL